MRLGSHYLGSSSLQVSTKDEQILPPAPSNWTMKYNFYKLSFMNDQDCTIKLNNDPEIFLRAGQGFQTDSKDAPIWSFIIREADISYNWIGAY